MAPSKSGKTTASHCLKRILRAKYNGPIHYLSFATIYKDIARLVGFNIFKKDVIDQQLGISPRDFLRSLGDFFRIHLPNKHPQWLKGQTVSFSTFFLTSKLQSLEGIVIIDDLRYMEEYEAMMNLGAKIAYIYRKGITIDYSHSSETELFEIVKKAQPIYIDNNSTVDNLKENVAAWFDTLGENLAELESYFIV